MITTAAKHTLKLMNNFLDYNVDVNNIAVFSQIWNQIFLLIPGKRLDIGCLHRCYIWLQMCFPCVLTVLWVLCSTQKELQTDLFGSKESRHCFCLCITELVRLQVWHIIPKLHSEIYWMCPYNQNLRETKISKVKTRKRQRMIGKEGTRNYLYTNARRFVLLRFR